MIFYMIHRIHAVSIYDDEQSIYKHIDFDLQELGLTDTCAKDIIDPIVDYIEVGYGRSTEDQLGMGLIEGQKQAWERGTSPKII